VLRKTQTSVGYRTEPSISSARFYIGALCNSAIKLAAPKRRGPLFFCVCAYPTLMVARQASRGLMRYTRKADQQRLARSAMERVGNTSVKPEADQVSNALNPLAKITG